MLHILLVTVRQGALSFVCRMPVLRPEGLPRTSNFREPRLWVLCAPRSPHLVIVDSEAPDTDPLGLVREMISANAMVNTAVVSALSDHEFHEAAEGFGILCRLPLDPGPGEAEGLLKKLRSVLMYVGEFYLIQMKGEWGWRIFFLF